MQAQKINCVNAVDPDGNPSGGYVNGLGIQIDWQNGPLGTGEERVSPNGAFVETVIQGCIQRLEAFQNSKFKCRENALAITKLEEALLWLGYRTARREAAGTEGTHNV